MIALDLAADPGNLALREDFVTLLPSRTRTAPPPTWTRSKPSAVRHGDFTGRTGSAATARAFRDDLIKDSRVHADICRNRPRCKGTPPLRRFAVRRGDRMNHRPLSPSGPSG